MGKDEAFDFLNRVARGVVEMFGSNCEALIHDFSEPGHPILAIYNGHVSGRSVGSTQDILGTNMPVSPQTQSEDLVNLHAVTPSGKNIKSSTFHLIGEDYNLALGINFDYSGLKYADFIIRDMMNTESDLKKAMWGYKDTVAALLDESISKLGKTAESMNKSDRMQVVTDLYRKNAFSLRRSVPTVARGLHVSRYTIYKYLSEIENGEPKNSSGQI